MSSKDLLQRISDMAETLIAKQEEVADDEATLEAAQKELLKIEREDLPALMAEAGMKEITLSSGRKLSIKADCAVSISTENKVRAFAWLQAHGYGGIIKTLVEVQFGKGEHDQAVQVAAQLKTKYTKNPVAVDESVHPSTLKAFVKERMAAGNPVPVDLFGAYFFDKAVISD